MKSPKLEFDKIKREINKLKKIRIEFLEPERLHPSSDTLTIAELGLILEKKYKLCEKFIDYTKPKIVNKAVEYLTKKTNRDWRFLLEEWLKGEWRDYMVSELHHIKTRQSIKENRESFIDTGSYYKSLMIRIVV